MYTYIIVGFISGILFGIMDAFINGNKSAQKLFEVFKPMARTSLNMVAGIIIDVVYGFVMAGLFILLYNALPGSAGILKGLCFAGIAWFFRVVMQAASQWMMYTIPVKTLVYTLLTGLAEMLVLGVFYGLTIKPWG